MFPFATSAMHKMRRRFKPTLELLAPRWLCAADFQNGFNELDVNDDGLVGPLDALLIIQQLNEDGSGLITRPLGSPRLWVDVTGDEILSPLDALLVINHLNAIGTSEVPLVANLSPASDPDGNGVVLGSGVTIDGHSVPGARLKLTTREDVVLLATADSAGKFQFSIELSTGTTSVRIVAADAQRRGGIIERSIVHGDAILNWNATMLTIVRDWTALSNDPYPQRIVTSQPPMVARNLAMVHAAMYDAVNAIEQTHQPYYVDMEAPAGAAPEAAAAAAAHRVASHLYKEPDERALFDTALDEVLSTLPDSIGKSLGVRLGEQIGDAILAWRNTDGSTSKVAYTPNGNPGDWRRTFPDFYPPLLPQWPQVKPFAMTSGEQFRPAPPPVLTSDEYAAAVNEVMAIGGLNSVSRTPEQTEIALFWADGGGTSTPAGHWNQIAADVAVAQHRSLAENARLFAMLNVAMADAAIACWDAKYEYELWRPVDAIRQAGTDGNHATVANAAWLPLIRTPPFPTYTSGHSSFSGAADVVLSHFLGESVAFSSQSDGQTGFTQRPLASERIVTRSFDSFKHAAEEASRSRVYGGIHFEFDSTAGLAAGRAIGDLVVANFLRPISE